MPSADTSTPTSAQAAAGTVPSVKRPSCSRRFFGRPVFDVLEALERLATTRRPGLLMAGMLVIGAATWFAYVPIHELLHVAGCEITGGDVSTLEILPRYGGNLLAKVFPWVVTSSDYAGRLSGFDTKGSDWIYLATDFGPFALTVVLGVFLVKLCTRRGRPILFPIAIVLGFAPFYNLTGDYYEMGSIITTRAATWIVGPRYAPPPAAHPETGQPIVVGGETDAAFAGMRSDDVFKLGADFFSKPSSLGIVGIGQFLAGLLIFLVATAMAVFLAFFTYWLGHAWARWLLPRRTVVTT